MDNKSKYEDLIKILKLRFETLRRDEATFELETGGIGQYQLLSMASALLGKVDREYWEKRFNDDIQNIINHIDDIVKFPPHHIRHDAHLKYFHEYADYQRSIFIMTKYPEDDIIQEKNIELMNLIKFTQEAIKECGYAPRLATDNRFHELLWDNVELCLLGCSKGVAILEDKINPELNPNVAMEWGWMRAMGKDVLCLVERNFNHSRADWSGLIKESFDWDNPEENIKKAINKWLKSK